MSGFFSFARAVTVLFAVLFLASCSGTKPFTGSEVKVPKLEGLVPLASSEMSATNDLRADVVEILMDSDDANLLKRHIARLELGEEANWTNKKTDSSFTVRAIEPMPEGDAGSRKIVVWGRKKGDTRTMVKTYRYHF